MPAVFRAAQRFATEGAVNPAHLLTRVSEHGFAVELTDDGPRLVPVVSGATMPPSVLAELKRHRGALVEYLTCAACGRQTLDTRHLERLRESCAFCPSVTCPYKARG